MALSPPLIGDFAKLFSLLITKYLAERKMFTPEFKEFWSFRDN
jgi:hypothetical protein